MTTQVSLRVGYDARMAIGAYRGMGRFLRQAISVEGPEFIGLCAKGESDSTLETHPGGFRFFPLWEQVSIPRRAGKLHLDCFLAPYNTAPLFLPPGLRLVVVIHDLIFMEPFSRIPASTSLYQNLGRVYRRFVVPRAAAKVDRIITVSEFSKREICSRLRVPTDRVVIIPCSIVESWYVDKPLPSSERGNYMLTVGGEAPSKNLSRAIESYSRAMAISGSRDDFPAFWVGGVSEAAQPQIAKEAQRRSVFDKVRLLPSLPLSELQSIYRKARLVFVPSLQEGFGIPLLEAMASGTPAVSSNATSLPEVGGAAPLYVNPLDPTNMAQGLLRMLNNPRLQTSAAESGLQQAKIFQDAPSVSFNAFWSEMAASN